MRIAMTPRRVLIAGLACALTTSAPAVLGGQSTSVSHKGLAITVAGVARATNVSLTDCPAGANIVRGVIRPGDTNEFASVTLDFKAQGGLTAADLPSPILHDDSGKTYKTAQTFAEIAAGSSFSCTFSYRVPKGTKLTRLAIDTASIDLATTAPATERVLLLAPSEMRVGGGPARRPTSPSNREESSWFQRISGFD